MVYQLHSHIKKTDGPPVTRLITRVPSFVEQSYAAVENFICQHGGGALRILQDSIRPYSNDCQFFHRE